MSITIARVDMSKGELNVEKVESRELYAHVPGSFVPLMIAKVDQSEVDKPLDTMTDDEICRVHMQRWANENAWLSSHPITYIKPKYNKKFEPFVVIKKGPMEKIPVETAQKDLVRRWLEGKEDWTK